MAFVTWVWFFSWIFLGRDCRFYRCMRSRNDDRSFCGVAWWFHLNNIAKAIVIVDDETARDRKYFLNILCAPIWKKECRKLSTRTSWTNGTGLYLGECVYYSTCNTFLIVFNTFNGILAAAIGLQIRDSNLRWDSKIRKFIESSISNLQCSG